MEYSRHAYVYLMVNPATPGWVKVGFTERNVEQRRQELSAATGVLEKFKIVHVFAVPLGVGVGAEKIAHRALDRFTRKKEFFRCTPDQAIRLLDEALAPLLTAERIDVPATRRAVEAAWDSCNSVYAELSVLRKEFDATKMVSETEFYRRRRETEQHVKVLCEFRLILNKLAAFSIVISICAIAWWAIAPGFAVVLLLPLGMIWIPFMVLRFFPISADELPEFKIAESKLRSELDQDISQAEVLFREREVELQSRVDAYRKEQRAAEEMLKSFNLSPRFKESRRNRVSRSHVKRNPL